MCSDTIPIIEIKKRRFHHSIFLSVGTRRWRVKRVDYICDSNWMNKKPIRTQSIVNPRTQWDLFTNKQKSFRFETFSYWFNRSFLFQPLFTILALNIDFRPPLPCSVCLLTTPHLSFYIRHHHYFHNIQCSNHTILSFYITTLPKTKNTRNSIRNSRFQLQPPSWFLIATSTKLLPKLILYPHFNYSSTSKFSTSSHKQPTFTSNQLNSHTPARTIKYFNHNNSIRILLYSSSYLSNSVQHHPSTSFPLFLIIFLLHSQTTRQTPFKSI